jgi:hypothetical protein
MVCPEMAARLSTALLSDLLICLPEEDQSMVRVLVLIAVFIGLLFGSVFSREFAALMTLGGIAGSCVALDWLTRPHEI